MAHRALAVHSPPAGNWIAAPDLVRRVAVSAGLRLFLPAEAGAERYNLQKFYSAPQLISSLLTGLMASGSAVVAGSQLQPTHDIDAFDDDEDAVDDADADGDGEAIAPQLPFRPSPLEHMLIHKRLNSSMILVGRAGTGKTTVSGLSVVISAFSLLRILISMLT